MIEGIKPSYYYARLYRGNHLTKYHQLEMIESCAKLEEFSKKLESDLIDLRIENKRLKNELNFLYSIINDEEKEKN